MSKKKSKKVLMIDLQKLKEQVPQNPVAKFAHHVNKAGFFRDRTVYSRKDKHKDRESFLIRYLTIFNKKGFSGLLTELVVYTPVNYFVETANIRAECKHEWKLPF
jgi:hypothetical protein